MNEKEKIEKELLKLTYSCGGINYPRYYDKVASIIFKERQAKKELESSLEVLSQKYIETVQAKKELVDTIEKMIIRRVGYSEIYNLINKHKEEK